MAMHMVGTSRGSCCLLLKDAACCLGAQHDGLKPQFTCSTVNSDGAAVLTTKLVVTNGIHRVDALSAADVASQ